MYVFQSWLLIEKANSSKVKLEFILQVLIYKLEKEEGLAGYAESDTTVLACTYETCLAYKRLHTYKDHRPK